MVTEEESELISGAKDNFKLLINILESCLERPDHHSKRFGFWAEECVEILNMLAANDTNKVSIINFNNIATVRPASLPCDKYFIFFLKIDSLNRNKGLFASCNAQPDT